jgi:hypothetical protein
VILSAHAAAWIAEQTKDPGAVDRLLGILFDGLAARPPTKAKAKPDRTARHRQATARSRVRRSKS